MAVENRIKRKTMVGLAFFLFSFGCAMFGYYVADLGWYWWVAGIAILALAAILYVTLVYDALLTDREEKVEV